MKIKKTNTLCFNCIENVFFLRSHAIAYKKKKKIKKKIKKTNTLCFFRSVTSAMIKPFKTQSRPSDDSLPRDCVFYENECPIKSIAFYQSC